MTLPGARITEFASQDFQELLQLTENKRRIGAAETE